MVTYFLNSTLGFFDLGELNVAKAKEVVFRVDGHFAAQDPAEGAELSVEVFVSPLELLKAFDEDRGRLDVLAAWLSFDCMHVVRQSSCHDTFDLGEPELLCGFLGIFD